MSRVGYQRVPLGDTSAAATDLIFCDRFNFIFRDRVKGVYDAADSNALKDFKKELYLINPYFFEKYQCDTPEVFGGEDSGEDSDEDADKKVIENKIKKIKEIFLNVQHRYLYECSQNGQAPNTQAIKHFKKKCHILIRELAEKLGEDDFVLKLVKEDNGIYTTKSCKNSDLCFEDVDKRIARKKKLKKRSKRLAFLTGFGEGVVAGVAAYLILPTHLKLLALLPGLGGAYSNYDTLKGEAYDLLANFRETMKINSWFKGFILLSCVVTAFLYAALQLLSWTQMNLGLSNVAVLALGSLTAIPSFFCLLGIVLGSFKKFYDKGLSGTIKYIVEPLKSFFDPKEIDGKLENNKQKWLRIFKTILKVAIAIAIFSVVSYFSLGIFTPLMLKLGSAAWLYSLGQGLAIVNSITWAPLLIPRISRLVGKVGSFLYSLKSKTFSCSRKDSQKCYDKYQKLEARQNRFISFFKHICCGSNSVGQGGLSADGVSGSIGNKLLAGGSAGLQSEGLNCTSIGSKDRIRIYRDSSYLEKLAKDDVAATKIQSLLFRPYLARKRYKEKKWYAENS